MDTGLSESDLVERSRTERAAIVIKYECGRQEGDNDGSEKVAPPWEDPQYEDYHITDKWGFIHDKRLPETHTKEEERSIEVESNRMLKWKKMTKTWNKYHGTGVKHRSGGGSSKTIPPHHLVSDKLYNRIYKGIPACFRGHVWGKLLNLDVIKQQQQGKYKEMKKLGCKWSPDVRQIDLDVNRTFRDNIMFRKRYDVKQQQLFYMLVAYSVYNQEVGYCQGMSQVAALLLMYMDEEDAFWALSALMADSKYAMHGFFVPGFPKLMRFQEQHNAILAQKLPNLLKHLQRNCIDAGLYTLKWFFQCYLDRVPFPLCLRLWDVYLVEGERLLLAAGYTILKVHRRSLQQLDMDRILDYLQKKLVLDFGVSEDEFITAVRKSLDELRRAKLDYPGPPPQAELPSVPFGTFKSPSIAAETGVRAEPGEQERLLTQQLIEQQQQLRDNASDKGSHTSLDQSIDDVSSVGGGVASGGGGGSTSAGVSATHHPSGGNYGSRISLANTSLTSAPDLSTLSSLTLARKNDIDQASLLSEKFLGRGLSGSGRSLISPDAKSVQSVRSPRSPPSGDNTDNVSNLQGAGSAAYQIDGLDRSKKSPRTYDTNSLLSSAASLSHPHLAFSPKQPSVREHRVGQTKEGTMSSDTADHRRSVLSDDGYYDQSDATLYRNFSPQHHNNGELNGDSDSDPNHSTSNMALGSARPNKLSVSQTTLIRDPDTVTSEPATPRAGEMPDTVRLYVPYAGNGEEGGGGGVDAEEVAAARRNKDDGSLLLKAVQVLSDASTKQLNECNILGEKVTKGHATPITQNGDNSGVHSAQLDPFRIKLHVDADETLSSLSSPRDLNSPRSVSSPLENNRPFVFNEEPAKMGRLLESEGKDLTNDLSNSGADSSSSTSYLRGDSELNSSMSFSGQMSGLRQLEQSSSIHSSKASDQSRSLSPDKSNLTFFGMKNDQSFSNNSKRLYDSSICAQNIAKSTTDIALSAPNQSSSNTKSQINSSSPTFAGRSPLTGKVSMPPPVQPRHAVTKLSSSPVNVTISSYYETKHHRILQQQQMSSVSSGQGGESSGRVQHYYHYRQSSTSPVSSPSVSPSFNASNNARSQSHASFTTDSPSSLPRVKKTVKEQQESSFSNDRSKTHQRNLSEHYQVEQLESAGKPQAQFQRGENRFGLSSSTSSLSAAPQKRVVTSYNEATFQQSNIVQRSLYNSSESYRQNRTSSATKYKYYESQTRNDNSLITTTSSSRVGAPQQNFKHFIADEPLTESYSTQRFSQQVHRRQQQHDAPPLPGSPYGGALLLKTGTAPPADKITRPPQTFHVPANAIRDNQRFENNSR